MPTKKKASGRKRDHQADLAELEELRKQIAERDKVEEARKAEEARKEEARKEEEAARKEEESQGKRQVSSRRQRTLVRWDVDTDIRLLLAIQYACNKLGFKIPWKDVAEAMGTKFTEGAIVQHLSKLRTKREEQDKPNPPPLKRAGNGYHKNDTNGKKEVMPSAKDDAAPSTRNGKRCRRNPSDEDSEDSVYTLKKKQFKKNKKKDKVFVAPKLRTKREETDSDDSQKLVCVGAEWLRDFTEGDDRANDDESTTSESENSTESSESTTQAAKKSQTNKKSKMVKLQVDPVRMAILDAKLRDSATSREPVTPTNPPRVVTNMVPIRSSYYPYMPANSGAAFSPQTPTPFSTCGASIQFPSNGPSPFDYVNRFSPATSEAVLGATLSPVSAGVSALDEINATAAYSRFDMAPEMQYADQYSGQGTFPITGYLETSGFENQFLSDSELFDKLPEVEPPRYLGYEGEDVKEF
ncbi:hypothetical protein N7537_003240 [Penicillium hordei]|uniref:Myb-like domain-containing protein n=1 Tax=Penicillium hordei TaxID=40994 RepID=A0AAD6H9N6_9EURO|nr:uncharacterized protein N7537_003240 [Penicillium hordei]KAJ5618126.1 hypothetical protein N7537_003240 [Penicillium hordei]